MSRSQQTQKNRSYSFSWQNQLSDFFYELSLKSKKIISSIQRNNTLVSSIWSFEVSKNFYS